MYNVTLSFLPFSPPALSKIFDYNSFFAAERLTKEYAEMYSQVFRAIGMSNSPVADTPGVIVQEVGTRFQCDPLNMPPPTTGQ